MLHGGLRPGEVLSLQLSDLQYGRKRVIIRYCTEHPADTNQIANRTSRGCSRAGNPQAVSDYVMNERPKEAELPFLFLVGGHGRRRCEPLGYHALAKLFERHCERLGIRTPWVTPMPFGTHTPRNYGKTA